MALQKSIEIRSRKKAIILILLPSLYFTFHFCNNIYQGIGAKALFPFENLFSAVINLVLAAAAVTWHGMP